MTVEESFAKLKAEIEKADREVKAAAQAERDEISSKVDHARREADERLAELRSKTGNGDAQATHWKQMQADWDQHIARLRHDMDEKKAGIDRDRAVRDAGDAYADANDAIEYAMSAVAEAEYATIQALEAEKYARQLGAPL